MRSARLLTHVVVLLVVLGISGYSSVNRQLPQALRLGATNAEALISGSGGQAGTIELGRSGTIVKPLSIPQSRLVSHDPVSYVVQPGDDLLAIAKRFNLSADDVCGSNPDLIHSPTVKAGDQLVLPPVPGVVMTVQGGQTAENVARTYQVGLDPLLDFNYLREPQQVQKGQRLVLPGGKGLRCPTSQEGPSRGLSLGPPGCPIHGAVLTQPFGPSRLEGFHSGIDLAGAAGTPIYAAAAGLAQVNRGNFGYGNNIIVQVSSSRADLYGHLSVIDVNPGQTVQAGQLIGHEGSTGFSTGPHLHFEVRIAGQAVNPAPLLRC